MSKGTTYRTGWISILLVVTELLFWSLFIGGYFFVKRISPNITVDNPDGVYLIPVTLVALGIFILFLAWRNKVLKRFSDPALVPVVLPNRSLSSTVLRFLIWRLGVAFVIIGFIDPKVGTKPETVQTQGIDIMVAIDVSNSMLAEDLSPSRLDLAKQTIQQLIGKLDGDRIGLVVFAGDAYVQLPITTDIQSAKVFLNAIETNSVLSQGTAIGTAIDLCVESFDPESEAGKAVLIFTDGENHEDDAQSAAQQAKNLGVKVYAVGMGSPEGAPIPEYNSSGNRIGYKTDGEGNTVVTSLNESMLVDIVQAGDGVFIRSGKSFVNLSPIFDDMGQMNEVESGSVEFSEYEHRFQFFVVIGLLLLVIEMLLGERKWNNKLSI
ncbi:MAG: VWA domain-containing protein [Flavobacteriales bacterium]|nr:VWA domain-containing protein [Flavobacteriales bacterium]MDG1781035.1 VWA domain-containing protein [Flavobacteriales bacterium]MDG2245785.1 VWA domain-containing protein [Flavobacteriales bacterium]